MPPVNPLRTQDELQKAYQKEYAFLEAQLRDLQTRLAQFESESRRDEQQREAQIDRVLERLRGKHAVIDLILEKMPALSVLIDERVSLPESMTVEGTSLSLRKAACLTSSLDASIFVAISAIIHWIAWSLAMGFPNWILSFALVVASSSALWAMSSRRSSTTTSTCWWWSSSCF